MKDDNEYRDTTITKVQREGDGGWSIQESDGWSFWVKAGSPVEPKVGMTARFYGKGIGYAVRGFALDGVNVFYETPDEYRERSAREAVAAEVKRRADYEAEKPKNDARIAALPEMFQRRIAQFREGNPNFGWEYEGYELFCCEQAAAFAEALKTDEAIVKFAHMDWDEQLKLVPAMSDGHSGNTYGASVALARLYVRDAGDVLKMTGCLAPLVGSTAFKTA
jgi:hypothetical protein